jgi:hypothetical protein
MKEKIKLWWSSLACNKRSVILGAIGGLIGAILCSL